MVSDQPCGPSEVAYYVLYAVDYSIDLLKSRSGNCDYRNRQIRLDLHNLKSEVQFYKSEALDENSIQASVSVTHFDAVAEALKGFAKK